MVAAAASAAAIEEDVRPSAVQFTTQTMTRQSTGHRLSLFETSEEDRAPRSGESHPPTADQLTS